MQIAMVAAGFTADEADQLRRAMAAWRRRGSVERFRQRLLAGMERNGYGSDFAQQIFQQLEGFGEYGFPESHSASFAKLAYCSAWVKCHEPAVFLTALLNSQPMGFYAPSQLVQDAQRHGVRVLPVDILASDWDSTLEPDAAASPRRSSGSAASGPAVRLGLGRVAGLSRQAGHRIEQARRQRPFVSTQDLAVRAGLNRREMNVLAAANALKALSGDRRQAQWQAAVQTPPGLLREAPIIEDHHPTLPGMSEGEHIASDYHSVGLTLGRHPLALLRSQLQKRRFVPAQDLLQQWPDRRLARACGLVTSRQRPGTAKGTVFVTLEDESGYVNVIVRAELAERQHTELTGSSLMGVYGVWQRHSAVCHLIAHRLVNLDFLLGQLQTRSRDFH